MRRSSFLSFDTISSYRKSQPEIQMLLLQRQLSAQGTQAYTKQTIKISDSLNIKPKYKKSNFYQFFSFETIHPVSFTLLIWNTINLFCIFYNFIVTPIGILIINFYQEGAYEQSLVEVDIAILIVFVIDIVAVRFRISYYEKQRVITSYEFIFKKYFKFPFLLDFLTIVGYTLYIIIPQIFYLKLFLLLKFYSYFDINQKILHKLITYPYTNAFYKFFRLVAFVVIITNLGACIYFAVDYAFYRDQGQYYEYGLFWLTASQVTLNMDLIIAFDWPIWYDYAMYFSVQSIADSGYGNITPRNPPEVLYTNLLILTFFVMYTVFKSEVYAIFTELDQKSNTKEQNMREFRMFIDENQAQQMIEDKANFYIQSYLRRSHQDQTQQTFYSYLSQPLKIQMKLAYNTQIYLNLPIMKTLFCQAEGWSKFAKKIIQSLKIRYFTKDDILFKAYSTENFKLMVILRGRILSRNFVLQNEKNYKQWEFVGQRQFFFAGINSNQVRCSTIAKLCYFDRREFFTILKNCQQQNEILKQAIQGVSINSKQGTQFDLCCNLCQKSHLQYFCEISNKWKNQIHRHGYKIESTQRKRQKYERNYPKIQKIINLSHVSCLQVDKYKKSKRYHAIYNIEEQK